MHHEVKLVDMHSGKVFYDKLTYIYIEMPKFRKTESELETLFDKWLYAIKNLPALMDRPATLQEAVFTRLFEQARISAFNPEELRDYRESHKDFWDLNSVLETAERKARTEGLAEGEAIGALNAMTKVALKMKRRGDSVADIIEMTGLSETEISAL